MARAAAFFFWRQSREQEAAYDVSPRHEHWFVQSPFICCDILCSSVVVAT
jgi:hypothetical protein